MSLTSIEETLKQATQVLKPVSDSPALDAEVLLCFVLTKERAYLRAWSEKSLTTPQQDQFQKCLQQRLTGVPIAYLTGKREFWSQSFKVTPDVLIPRPDTELLIELSLEQLQKCLKSPYQIIDLGTGSGIIGISLALELPDAQIIATDKSEAALKVAQENAQYLDVANIRFCQSDWFSGVENIGFDMVVSNPPYIAENDPHLDEGDLRFEPQTALQAENNGLKDIDIILNSARKYLKHEGLILIEHGYNQQDAVQALFNDYGYVKIQTYTDLAQQPRVTTAQWKA